MMLKSFITKFHQIPIKLITKNTVVDELWKLKLDEDEEKDKLKKTMIACINIGLLEKTNQQG